MTSFLAETQTLETLVDFLRFGLTSANQHTLYYGHGTDNAWDDVFSLIFGSLALPYDVDERLWSSKLTANEKRMLSERLYKRIIEHIPVPYLTQQAFFCDLPFFVDSRVLIPRSPIAELIKAQFSPWVAPENVTRVLDLCTGSGCIAIACCYAFPEAQVDAVDLSQDALDVAAINLKSHQLEEQLTLIASDCWQQVPKTRYDIIVSNPPYVGDEEMASLPDEYTHEPDMALRAPNNGLALVDEILKHAYHYLSEQGILVVEVGNSDIALEEAYPHVPFTWIEFEHGGHGVFVLTYAQLKQYFS